MKGYHWSAIRYTAGQVQSTMFNDPHHQSANAASYPTSRSTSFIYQNRTHLNSNGLLRATQPHSCRDLKGGFGWLHLHLNLGRLALSDFVAMFIHMHRQQRSGFHLSCLVKWMKEVVLAYWGYHDSFLFCCTAHQVNYYRYYHVHRIVVVTASMSIVTSTTAQVHCFEHVYGRCMLTVATSG